MKTTYLRNVLTFSICIAFYLLPVNNVSAQWSIDPFVNTPIVTDTNSQSGCLMCTDGSGGSIITWYDYNLTYSHFYIYAQRINSAGFIQWDSRGVPICVTPYFTQLSGIVSDGSGGALITWVDSRNIPDDVKNEIFAQKIDSTGVVQWTTNGVSVGTESNHFQQTTPAITGDDDGGAIIAWDDWRGDLSHPFTTMRAQRISSGGSIMWGNGGIALNAVGNNGGGSTQIISDGSGGAIVAWDQWEGVYPAGNRDVFAQKINASGNILWGTGSLKLCSQTSQQSIPFLTGDDSGGAIIAWQDYRNGSNSNLFAQKINAAGTPLWTVNGVQVSSLTAIGQINQRLLGNGSGGAFIVWQYTSNTVCAQLLNSGGTAMWNSDGVTVCDNRESLYPELISDGNTGIIVTWNNLIADVHAQHIGSAGESLWNPIGAEVSTANENQIVPKIVTDGAGGAIIAWVDFRNEPVSSSDIYAQQISSTGSLGVVTGFDNPIHSSSGAFKLYQNYPNPASGITRINFKIIRPGLVILKVYDLTGQEVSVPVNSILQAGNYSVDFNSANLPSGTYTYRMECGIESASRNLMIVR